MNHSVDAVYGRDTTKENFLSHSGESVSSMKWVCSVSNRAVFSCSSVTSQYGSESPPGSSLDPSMGKISRARNTVTCNAAVSGST